MDSCNQLIISWENQFGCCLKETANLFGIKKKLTTHCLRHTFGTIMLTKGVSIESVLLFSY
ncbi:tyrosine-type recombinase/integrase [Dysgonomonas sp. GY75]|nr:tyrosine-type recombinase/integrase [Dysgonomonas sp. GY75]